MKKQTWIPMCIIVFLLVAGFFIFESSSSANAAEKPCPTDAMAKCSQKAADAAPGEMIMESVSRQFL